MRAASEMGIRTVAIYSNEDRFALHRFKADEAYLVGEGQEAGPGLPRHPDIIRVAKDGGGVDAIHPGYGFLSENPDFADACAAAGITFIGPRAGNHAHAWQQGQRRASWPMAAGVPVMPATDALPDDLAEAIKKLAARSAIR
jgi:pyruvate carboxylase